MSPGIFKLLMHIIKLIRKQDILVKWKIGYANKVPGYVFVH